MEKKFNFCVSVDHSGSAQDLFIGCKRPLSKTKNFKAPGHVDMPPTRVKKECEDAIPFTSVALSRHRWDTQRAGPIVLFIDLDKKEIYQFGPHWQAALYHQFLTANTKSYRIYIDHPRLIARDMLRFRRLGEADENSVLAISYQDLFDREWHHRMIPRVCVQRNDPIAGLTHLVLGQPPILKYRKKYTIYPIIRDEMTIYMERANRNLEFYNASAALGLLVGLNYASVYFGGDPNPTLGVMHDFTFDYMRSKLLNIFVHVPRGWDEVRRFMRSRSFTPAKWIIQQGQSSRTWMQCAIRNDKRFRRVLFFFFYKQPDHGPIPWSFMYRNVVIVDATDLTKVWCSSCFICDFDNPSKRNLEKKIPERQYLSFCPQLKTSNCREFDHLDFSVCKHRAHKSADEHALSCFAVWRHKTYKPDSVMYYESMIEYYEEMYNQLMQ